MSTETDLLAAVLARRDDDGPRLAYADWLEQRADDLVSCPACGGWGKYYWLDELINCQACGGEGKRTTARRERAELIRTEIEMWSLWPGVFAWASPLSTNRDFPPNGPEWWGRWQRACDLRKAHGDVWFGVDADMLGVRGFPGVIRASQINAWVDPTILVELARRVPLYAVDDRRASVIAQPEAGRGGLYRWYATGQPCSDRRSHPTIRADAAIGGVPSPIFQCLLGDEPAGIRVAAYPSEWQAVEALGRATARWLAGQST